MELWAKYDDRTQVPHLLVHHLADVAAVSEALLSLPLFRRRIARTAGRDELSPSAVSRLCFLAALHDLGKCNAGFQRKIRGETKYCGHVGPCLLLFNDEMIQSRALDALMIDHLTAWCGGLEPACRLLLATISHHGRPIRRPVGVDRRVWMEGTPEPLTALERIVQEVSAWFPTAFESVPDTLPTNPEFQHAFNGLISLADWIGSDTRFFPFSKNAEEDRIGFAREKAKEALVLIGTDPEPTREIISDGLPGFRETFRHESPRPLQAAIEGLKIENAGGAAAAGEYPGSITILEAETGSGKTEAAFLRFEQLFRAGKVDGIYFALPTRAAATQIHQRIYNYARNAFGDKAPPVVLAVPGYIRVDDEKGERKPLPDFQVLWPDEDRFRYRGWAGEHPKRYLAGSIIVGTIDQVLLSALAVSHAQMRFTALTRLLLVVDEVHASDTYMGTLLEEVLSRHTAAGGQALLLSATLGAGARTGYLLLPRQKTPGLEEAIEVPYPAIVSLEMGAAPIIRDIKRDGRDKEVRVEIQPPATEAESVAGLALRELRKGGRILVLRNLVKDVIRTQEAVEALPGNEEYLFQCRGVVAPHHGRYAPEDRKALDEEIERRFGEAGPAGPGLVVASRTVEQSLDIDFDLIITDLAPMDVLLQRIGRLHRHLRPRPAGFEVPRVIVLVPPDRDLNRFIIETGERRGEARGPIGLGTVFDNLLIIEATLRLLEENPVFRIPAMNRLLVEMSTHPENIAKIKKELGGVWEEHFNRVQGRGFARGGAARISLFDRTIPFGEIGFADLEKSVATRLGENDRIVLFPEPIRSPFGNQLKSLGIPGWMVPGCSVEELSPSIIEAPGSEITFSCCGRQFTYDRLGLRSGNV